MRTEGKIWLLECKADEWSEGQRALARINSKGYHQRYAGRPVTLIGIDFSRDRRNLAGFAWEQV